MYTTLSSANSLVNHKAFHQARSDSLETKCWLSCCFAGKVYTASWACGYTTAKESNAYQKELLKLSKEHFSHCTAQRAYRVTCAKVKAGATRTHAHSGNSIDHAHNRERARPHMIMIYTQSPSCSQTLPPWRGRVHYAATHWPWHLNSRAFLWTVIFLGNWVAFPYPAGKDIIFVAPRKNMIYPIECLQLWLTQILLIHNWFKKCCWWSAS